MRIDQFETLLYDMFQMDAPYPKPIYGFRTEFRDSSYAQWGIDELKNYIISRFNLDNYATIADYLEWTEEFILKMDSFSSINPKYSRMFIVAKDMAMNVYEVLESMK